MMWTKTAHRGVAVGAPLVSALLLAGACDLRQSGTLSDDASTLPDATVEGGGLDVQSEGSVDDGPTSDVVDAAVTPKTFAGLEYLFRADEGITFDAGVVVEWDDQSGKNDPTRNAFPGTYPDPDGGIAATFAPPSVINPGFAAVFFANGQGLRTGKLAAPLPDPTTVFLIAGKDPPFTNPNYLFDSNNKAAQHGMTVFADGRLCQVAPTNGKCSLGPLTKPMAIVAVYNGAGSFVLQNANRSDAGTASPGPVNSIDGLTLGSYSGGFSVGFGGYIAEFALYSRQLSDTEISQLNAYAAKRYGIVIQ